MPKISCFDPREANLFKNRNNQAVRIPVDLAFDKDVERVRVYRDGERLIVEPIHKNELVALLNSWQPLDEDFPAIEDELSTSEEIFNALYA